MTRRFIGCLVVSLGLASGLDAQRPEREIDPRPAMGEVSGVVWNGEPRGGPAGNALVMIAGTDVGLMRVTATDSAGRFTFTGLPAGRFLVGAGKSSRMAALYGASRVGRPGTAVQLVAGEKIGDLRLILERGAAIEGRVLDENGEAVAGARVRVLQRRIAGDEIWLTGDFGDPAGATTDDRGAYRIYDLPPGEYAVAAQPRSPNAGNARPLTPADVDAGLRELQVPAAALGAAAANGLAIGYAQVYYPSAATPAQAATISLKAGEDRTGVDLGTRLIRLARIDGIVVNAGGPVPSTIQIALRPRDSYAVGVVLNALNVNAGPGGRFTLAGVAPGEYTIFARTLPPPVPPDQSGGAPAPFGPLSATSDVVVTGENVTNVTLGLRPGITVSGRVVLEGVPELPKDFLARVGIRSTLASGVPNLPEPAGIDAAGRFTLTNIPVGRYRLFATIPASGASQVAAWIQKSALVDGRDALDVPIDLLKPHEAVGEVVVTLTAKMQEITGMVRDSAGRPRSNDAVVVFPVDQRFWFPQSRRIAYRQTHGDGGFVFGVAAGLPPGDYYIGAVPDLGPGEQFDPSFLIGLAASAERFTLSEGASQTIELTVAKKN